MSHCDLNIEMTGLAGLFGIFTKNTAPCVFATGLRSRHFAPACLHFQATVLRERHVASLHASSTVGFLCPSSQRLKKYNTLWLKWVSCVRCYEPRTSVRQCAAMSHCELNIEMTGLAGLFGIFTKNTAPCAFATGLRSRHFAPACLHFQATVLRERHVASLHALARVLTEYVWHILCIRWYF